MATKKAVVKKTVVKKAKVEKKVELNPKVWSVPYNADLVAQVLLVMRSNARQGNAKAKTRAMVSGGGKKPWKQKGTGRARAGSIRSPLWIKGGVTFPPNWRNWERKVNKKMRRLAIVVLLSEKLRKERLEIVKIAGKETLSDLRKAVVKGLELGRWNLIVTDNEKVESAFRNVPKVMVLKPLALNALAVALAKKILIDEKIVNVIEERYANEK